MLEDAMHIKVEELAAKALGAAKAVKATLEGLDGVFRHLVREHGEVSALLLRLKLSADPNVRRELWHNVRNALLAHERAEMLEVYPALRQVDDTRLMALEHDQFAEELQEAIDEVNATATDSPNWQPTLERLIQLVQEHVRDEEEEYFPIADRAFKGSSNNLLARFEKAKAEALRQLQSS
jgi:hemerythrin superfamily protein